MSERFRARLAQEVPLWVRDGILTEEQGRHILERGEASAREGRQDLTVRLVSWIGASLVAVGIIVLVATNWSQIHPYARMLILAASTAALWGTGAALLQRRRLPALGHVLLFLGGGAFGGLVFQTANTWHLAANDPNLVAIWMLGILPVAYGLRSQGLHAMAVLLFPLWVAVELGAGGLQDARAMVMTLMAGGLLLWGVGLLHPRWSERDAHRLPRFQETYLGVGALLLHIPAFVYTFMPEGLHRQPLFGGADPGAVLWAVTLWVGAMGALAAGLRWGGRKPMDAWGVALAGVGALLFLFPLWVPAGAVDDVAFGILLVAWVVLAVQARSELLFNLGLLLFVAMVVGRYIEFVADEGNPGWIFVVGGTILIALALVLERLRRAMTPRIRGEA